MSDKDILSNFHTLGARDWVTMFEWLYTQLNMWMEYLVPFLYKKNATILFLGLDDAGKTTLLYRLKEGRMIQALPTPMPTNEHLCIGKVTFNTYDLGGHKQVRRIWRDYMPVAQGIVFIVDSANRLRFPEARRELEEVLCMEEIQTIPIVVLANKIDLPGAASELEIVNYFNLHNRTGKGHVPGASLEGRRPLEVFTCSILKEQGYGLAFKWLSQHI